MRGTASLARVAALVAVVIAAAFTVVVLLKGASGGYTVQARFQNASQLVKGNLVQVSGIRAGTVENIRLTPDGQAELTLNIDEKYAPLRRGTQATVRQASLSGVANRYVDLRLAGAKSPAIPDGGVDPAQAAGLPRAGRVPRGHDPGHGGGRPDRRRVGRQGPRARGRPGPQPHAGHDRARARVRPAEGERPRDAAPEDAARRDVRRAGARPWRAGAPEGGRLADGRVAETVQLDEIFDSLDPATRASVRTWQQDMAKGIEGRGRDFDDALGTLPDFAADGADVLKVLDTQEGALQRLVKNTGVTFDALTENEAQLRTLITSSNRVFHATTSRNDALAESIRIFPTFLDESKATFARLETFSADTRPLVQDLRPVARDLKPTLADVRVLALDLERFFRDLWGRWTSSARSWRRT